MPPKHKKVNITFQLYEALEATGDFDLKWWFLFASNGSLSCLRLGSNKIIFLVVLWFFTIFQLHRVVLLVGKKSYILFV